MSVNRNLIAGMFRPHSAVVKGAPRRLLPWLCLLLAVFLCRPEQAPARPASDFAPSAASAFWSSPAFAAAVPENGAPKELGDRGVMLSRQDLRGKINAGGPEAWPESGGLSTTTLPVPGEESAASGERPAEARPDNADGKTEAPETADMPASPSTATVVPEQPAPPAALDAPVAPERSAAEQEAGAPAPSVAAQDTAPQTQETGPKASGTVNTKPVGLPADQK